ncbi:MAG: LuxR C-terminal-related transcriptional regulator, partial [Gammaproteobacteria bacterium]|nr:LuxR C-terminal-related transcriptional regulator [Gammaproteobacteria bacterium]
LENLGEGGMLSMARTKDPLSESEIIAKSEQMDWLSNVIHFKLSRIIKAEEFDKFTVGGALTAREREVLKWSADGKSSQDIAEILKIAKNTVDFHIKNAILKLQAANKTSAVIRAYAMGYLV